MTDRTVRQLVPKPDEADQRKLFSAFSDQPNLVLLGAPGAGKTHLFTGAAAENGKRVTTRDFLNIPTFPPDTVLFIDALDECRTGRTDQGTIDSVVKKLFEVHPAKVRISCRESDWLGATDLATFQPYFDANGGSVVLALEHLTENEQRAVLATLGVINPDEFLKQAAERGLDDLLTNPQNLVMLAKVVGDGNWPRNRTELFEKATRILLSEHNPTRARSGDGIYGPDELRSPTGSVMAARLISDVSGVSLTDNQIDDDYPSYRTAPYPDIERVRAALGRRAFIGNGEEAADYTHRTTAEFLGAEWLAKQVKNGLPIGRVRALIGVDGHPAPELRGLHAWLAVLCPAHANELIDSDPYGVLTYGDADSLSPSHRKRLLAALARLSETDPWFGRNDRTAPNVGALASADLAPSFRTILKSKTAHFSLKKLVLSALAAGTPLISVQKELLAIFLSPKEPYALRDLAFDALKRLGAPGITAIKQAYPQLGKDESDIRLRAAVVGDLYQEFSVTDAANVLNDALNCPRDLPGGILLSLYRAVPITDIPGVIESIQMGERGRQPSSSQVARAERHNAYDVSFTVSRLIIRYLKESSQPISVETGWKMLVTRRALWGALGRSSDEALHAELKQRTELLRGMFEKAMDEFSEAPSNYVALRKFREATTQAMDEKLLTQCMVERARSAKDSSAKQALIYRMAIELAISTDSTQFDELYFFGDSRPDLATVRDDNIFSSIEDWRQEDALRRAQHAAETEDDEVKTRQAFERDKQDIRSGKHLGWMRWLAEVYFDPYLVGESDTTPHQRLEQKIGAENVKSAFSGFEACLERTDLPSVAKAGNAVVKNSYPSWWYAPLAGMDERWTKAPSLKGFSDELLRKMVAIKLVSITQRREGNTLLSMEHLWYQTALRERPELVSQVCAEIAGIALAKNVNSTHGLYELLNDETFASTRKNAVLKLLRKYPAAPIQQLEDMLRAALSFPHAYNELNELAQKVLDKSDKLGGDQRALWLSVGFLISPDQHTKGLRKAAKKPAIVWRLRSLFSEPQRAELTVKQLEIIVIIVAGHFPEVPHPSSSSGDQNPWDGSEFVRYLIDHLSTRVNEHASASLRRLAELPALITYRDFIKHTLANQQARVREAQYRQPNWKQAVAALLNEAPANFADLQALVLDHCRDLNNEISNRNIDIYKQFWNEKSHSKVSTPRSEDTSRNFLVGMLQTRLRPLNITVEPEGHMAADKRVDVSVALDHRKTMMEWKRDYHPDVWHAHETQLDRLYTPDPDASGYGIYGVFWFGARRPRKIPVRPDRGPAPQSAADMQKILQEMIPVDKRSRLGVIVIDVSGPGGGGTRAKKIVKKGGAKRTTKAPKSKSTKLRPKRRRQKKQKPRASTSGRGQRQHRPALGRGQIGEGKRYEQEIPALRHRPRLCPRHCPIPARASRLARSSDRAGRHDPAVRGDSRQNRAPRARGVRAAP
jgi:hypothetical protein